MLVELFKLSQKPGKVHLGGVDDGEVLAHALDGLTVDGHGVIRVGIQQTGGVPAVPHVGNVEDKLGAVLGKNVEHCRIRLRVTDLVAQCDNVAAEVALAQKVREAQFIIDNVAAPVGGSAGVDCSRGVSQSIEEPGKRLCTGEVVVHVRVHTAANHTQTRPGKELKLGVACAAATRAHIERAL